MDDDAQRQAISNLLHSQQQNSQQENQQHQQLQLQQHLNYLQQQQHQQQQLQLLILASSAQSSINDDSLKSNQQHSRPINSNTKINSAGNNNNNNNNINNNNNNNSNNNNINNNNNSESLAIQQLQNCIYQNLTSSSNPIISNLSSHQSTLNTNTTTTTVSHNNNNDNNNSNLHQHNKLSNLAATAAAVVAKDKFRNSNASGGSSLASDIIGSQSTNSSRSSSSGSPRSHSMSIQNHNSQLGNNYNRSHNSENKNMLPHNNPNQPFIIYPAHQQQPQSNPIIGGLNQNHFSIPPTVSLPSQSHQHLNHHAINHHHQQQQQHPQTRPLTTSTQPLHNLGNLANGHIHQNVGGRLGPGPLGMLPPSMPLHNQNNNFHNNHHQFNPSRSSTSSPQTSSMFVPSSQRVPLPPPPPTRSSPFAPYPSTINNHPEVFNGNLRTSRSTSRHTNNNDNNHLNNNQNTNVHPSQHHQAHSSPFNSISLPLHGTHPPISPPTQQSRPSQPPAAHQSSSARSTINTLGHDLTLINSSHHNHHIFHQPASTIQHQQPMIPPNPSATPPQPIAAHMSSKIPRTPIRYQAMDNTPPLHHPPQLTGLHLNGNNTNIHQHQHPLALGPSHQPRNLNQHKTSSLSGPYDNGNNIFTPNNKNISLDHVPGLPPNQNIYSLNKQQQDLRSVVSGIGGDLLATINKHPTHSFNTHNNHSNNNNLIANNYHNNILNQNVDLSNSTGATKSTSSATATNTSINNQNMTDVRSSIKSPSQYAAALSNVAIGQQHSSAIFKLAHQTNGIAQSLSTTRPNGSSPSLQLAPSSIQGSQLTTTTISSESSKLPNSALSVNDPYKFSEQTSSLTSNSPTPMSVGNKHQLLNTDHGQKMSNGEKHHNPSTIANSIYQQPSSLIGGTASSNLNSSNPYPTPSSKCSPTTNNKLQPSIVMDLPIVDVTLETCKSGSKSSQSLSPKQTVARDIKSTPSSVGTTSSSTNMTKNNNGFKQSNSNKKPRLSPRTGENDSSNNNDHAEGAVNMNNELTNIDIKPRTNQFDLAHGKQNSMSKDHLQNDITMSIEGSDDTSSNNTMIEMDNSQLVKTKESPSDIDMLKLQQHDTSSSFMGDIGDNVNNLVGKGDSQNKGDSLASFIEAVTVGLASVHAVPASPLDPSNSSVALNDEHNSKNIKLEPTSDLINLSSINHNYAECNNLSSSSTSANFKLEVDNTNSSTLNKQASNRISTGAEKIELLPDLIAKNESNKSQQISTTITISVNTASNECNNSTSTITSNNSSLSQTPSKYQNLYTKKAWLKNYAQEDQETKETKNETNIDLIKPVVVEEPDLVKARNNTTMNERSLRRFSRRKVKSNLTKLKEDSQTSTSKLATLNETKDNGKNTTPKNAIKKGVKSANNNKESIKKTKHHRQLEQQFLQTCPCYDIVPKNIRCLECRRVRQTNLNKIEKNTNSAKGVLDITKSELSTGITPNWDDFCRFYEFRKLRRNKQSQIVVAGFSDIDDVQDSDKELWLPREAMTFTESNLTFETAKYILENIGEHFCGIVVQERVAKKRYDSIRSLMIKKESGTEQHENNPNDKKIIWKRAVNGLRELCDVCSTTLFNFHHVCERCGFVVCIDCFETKAIIHGTSPSTTTIDDLSKKLQSQHSETSTDQGIEMGDESNRTNDSIANNNTTEPPITGGNFNLGRKKSKKDHQGWIYCSKNLEHSPEDMTLAQIIADDCLEEIWKLMHATRSKLKLGECICNYDSDKNPESYDGIHQMIQEMIHQMTSNQHSNDDKNVNDQEEHNYDNPIRSYLCDGNLLVLEEPNHDENMKLFRAHWLLGKPVVVRGVHKNLDMEQWKPQYFAKEFGDYRSDLVDCRNGDIHRHSMKKYWDGFEPNNPGATNNKKRIREELPSAHNEGLSIGPTYYSGSPLWRLKDWPPGQDFSEILPEHYKDFMTNLPLNEYTTRLGQLNLACRLPSEMLKPDLGPKMYCAYGTAEFPERGTTNLHLDISDAVNVMIYVGGANAFANGSNEIAEVYEKAIDSCNVDHKMKNEIKDKRLIPGALWHIFNPSDTVTIRIFLNKVAEERDISPNGRTDPIHDQTWYLDQCLLDRLFNEHGVRSYPILQCMGDAVLIPAGAPHQVKNVQNCIKVANDFVSPENIKHCLKLTNEFRALPETHINQEDKLQIKNILYHSVKDSLEQIRFHESNKKF